jgi:hypothetical protein
MPANRNFLFLIIGALVVVVAGGPNPATSASTFCPIYCCPKREAVSCRVEPQPASAARSATIPRTPILLIPDQEHPIAMKGGVQSEYVRLLRRTQVGD